MLTETRLRMSDGGTATCIFDMNLSCEPRSAATLVRCHLSSGAVVCITSGGDTYKEKQSKTNKHIPNNPRLRLVQRVRCTPFTRSLDISQLSLTSRFLS